MTTIHVWGASYLGEILDHARVPWTRVDQLPHSGDPRSILIFTEPPTLNDAQVADLTAWTRSGGAILALGGAGDLAPLAGAHDGELVNDGHVHAHLPTDWGRTDEVPLPAFGGTRLRVDAGTPVAWWHSGGLGRDDVAISIRPYGAGWCVIVGADVAQSVVRIQQGRPIACDGTPPTDGSAPVDDDILKSDDGISLSYTADRTAFDADTTSYRHEYPPTERPPFFAHAHADRWRALLLRGLWWLGHQTEQPMIWLHYWPAGQQAAAHLSHDTDGNRDEQAADALDTFAEAGVHTTWCFLYPGGLSAETVARVQTDGHEVALHFNALDEHPGCGWGRDELALQLDWLAATTGLTNPVTNKNHYLRWEGGTEFFEWCEDFGIQLDQSHGPSKQGNIGFPFGSCHLSFPVTDQGRMIDVLSLPLQTQDLAWTTPVANRDVMLDEAIDAHGVFHCLFHGSNISPLPEVRQAVLDTVVAVRDRGVRWWTSTELNTWERNRRQVDVTVHADGDGWLVSATSRVAIVEAALMVVLPRSAGTVHLEDAGSLREVTRHGLTQLELTADLPAGTSTWRLTRDSTSTKELL